ncbi:hypothetical protein ACX80N_12650 [Arthrobacter sp. MDT2-16]
MEQPTPDISHLKDVTAALAEHNVLIESNSFVGWHAICTSSGCLWEHDASELEVLDGLLNTAAAQHVTEMLMPIIAQRQFDAAAWWRVAFMPAALV